MRAYDRVQAARKANRPSGRYYIDHISDSFFEMHGDRRFADDGAIVGGIGTIKGKSVTFIAMERGDTLEERMRCGFGCPRPEGYRKALRLMKQAEKFSRPVVCFIGSSGAFCGIDAEQRGQGEAIAENLMEMMTLRTPIVSVVVGEGGSGGALALSVADKIIMLENSVYSVISPEGCASILWKDSQKAPEAAEALHLTAADLKELSVADEIIAEGENVDSDCCARLKAAIVAAIAESEKLSVDEMLEKRYNKFRKFK